MGSSGLRQECIPVLQFCPRGRTESRELVLQVGTELVLEGLAKPGPPEVRLRAEAPSQALAMGLFPPLALPPLSLPFCWGFWSAEDFGPLEDFGFILRA